MNRRSMGGDGQEVRRAGQRDRDERVYERARSRQARQRARQEREQFDPAPPSDEDWTTPDPDPASDALRKVAAPSLLGEAVAGFVRRRGWEERLRGAQVFARWEELVGVQLAQQCEPVRVAGGTLVVRAATQTWATQLQYLTPTLLRSMEQALGPGVVRDVRVVVGPLTGTPESS